MSGKQILDKFNNPEGADGKTGIPKKHLLSIFKKSGEPIEPNLENIQQPGFRLRNGLLQQSLKSLNLVLKIGWPARAQTGARRACFWLEKEDRIRQSMIVWFCFS